MNYIHGEPGESVHVIADEQALYCEGRLGEWTLIRGPDAQLGEITFDMWMWLAQQ